MTPERAKELWPVVKAYSEGRDIQRRVVGTSEWLTVTDPQWVPGVDYRIKPIEHIIYAFYREKDDSFYTSAINKDRAEEILRANPPNTIYLVTLKGSRE